MPALDRTLQPNSYFRLIGLGGFDSLVLHSFNLRYFITYLLIGAFLVHASSRVIIYLNYLTNQEYIAKNLCENRDKPQLKCNGKCHLKKELEKNEERKEHDNKSQVEMLLFILPDHHRAISVRNSFSDKEKQLAFVSKQKTSGFVSFVFRPPTC